MEVAPAMDNSGATKRRKVGNGELMLPSLKSVRITGRDGEDEVNASMNLSDSVKKEDLAGSYADETSFISGDIPVSCCSIDGSIFEKLKYADLEVTAETETTVRGNLVRRESSSKQLKTHSLSPNSMSGPTSEFKAESGEIQRRTVPAAKTPPAAELEEFFAAAEKDIQNRFKNKYNYDIVNDVPLKGRYEWIQLKP